ncbi:hypothetical protein ACX818_001433 [Acinetobacter baumannii]
MKISVVAAKKLETRVLNYLNDCYMDNTIPHEDSTQFYDFISYRIKQIEKLSKFIKESVEVEIPPRYLDVITEIIGD